MKKVLLLLASIAIICLGMYFNTFQAYIPLKQWDLPLGVNSITRGDIYANYPLFMNQYESINITGRVKNTGSVAFTQRMSMYIMNYNASMTMMYFYDDTVTLLPGETRTVNMPYTAYNHGFYWVHLNSSYWLYVNDFWGALYVLPRYWEGWEEWPAEIIFVEIPTGTWYEIEVGEYVVEMEYDTYIEVIRGQDYIMPLYVKNIPIVEGNRSLRIVTVLPRGSGIPFDVNPKMIEKISATKQGMFIITLHVPYNIDPGNYTLDFLLMVNRTDFKGRVTVNVQDVADIKSVIERMIENYRYIIQRTNSQVKHLLLQGKNISVAAAYLEAAKEEFGLAQHFYNLGDYEMAREKLGLVREYLEQCALELGVATAPPIPFILPGYVTTILMIAVIALVAFVVSYWFFIVKRRGKKKKKAAEEEEEAGPP